MLKLSVVVILCYLHSSFASNGLSLPAVRFTLDLLKTVPQDKNGNMVFSPLGVYSLLAALQQTSLGSSRAELDQVLHASPEVTLDALKSIAANIEQSDSVPSLRFVSKSRTKGDVSTQQLQGFLDHGNLPRSKSSNAWKNYAEGPKTPSLRALLSKVVVSSASSSKSFAALANILFLDGMWGMEVESRKLMFRPNPSEQFETGGVHMKKYCFGGATPEFRWVHVPLAVRKASSPSVTPGVRPSGRSQYWSKRDVSLMVMLPNQKNMLDQMVQTLTPETLSKSFNHSAKDRKSLEITMPNFLINSDLNLKPVLRKLGLRNILGNGRRAANGSTNQDIYLSKLTQKGKFLVDVYGARTSDNTEINFPYSFMEPWDETQLFAVDEPFLFFIVDTKTSMPLVAGRVTRPESFMWNP